MHFDLFRLFDTNRHTPSCVVKGNLLVSKPAVKPFSTISLEFTIAGLDISGVRISSRRKNMLPYLAVHTRNTKHVYRIRHDETTHVLTAELEKREHKCG